MLICDCHCDTLTKIHASNQSLYQNSGHFDLRRFINCGGGLQFAAIYIDSCFQYGGGIKYTLSIMDKYLSELASIEAEQKVSVLKVEDAADLDLLAPGKPAILLSIEDGSALEASLEVLRMYYRLGVRCLTLTWNNRNSLGDGAAEIISDGGLTNFGRSVVREMNRLGMLIDVSHLAPKGFWHTVELSQQPVIATHSNSHTLCPVPRNLHDDQIKAIAKSGGVIGINFYPPFLEMQPEKADIDSIFRHIDYMLELVGERHVALGADFDGIDSTPQGISGVESFALIMEYLLKKNYRQSTVENIAGNNVINLLRAVLKTNR